MPTATEFIALGAGNGFASCLTSINITDKGFDKWTTLGGNSKGGSVTESGKGLAQAMQFYWNLEGFRFSASASASRAAQPNANPPRPARSASASIGPNYSSDADSSIKIIPIDRVCGGSLKDISVRDYDYDNGVAASCSFGFSSWNSTNEIYRYYNGVTRNEDNFVGYGLALDNTGFGQDSRISIQASASPRQYAAAFLRSGSSHTEDDYVSVSSNIGLDFHFVGNTSDSDSGGNSQAQVSFDSLDFYTY